MRQNRAGSGFRQRKRAVLVAASGSAIALCAVAAQAQDAPPQLATGVSAPAGVAGETPTAPAPSAPGTATSQAPSTLDIVVTAQKKSQFLRDVPVAVTAVSGNTLATNNIARVTDLVAIVPNFTLSLAALQPITFIRGFGTTGSFSFEQAVGKFVDNVSFGREFDGRIPLYDLERVEVLKGPQVLLYGNSATAGALNITTRKPGNVFEADGSVGYEFVGNEVLAQGGVTVPIAQNLSVRVAGIYQDLDKGWIHNTLTGADEPTYRNYGGRAIVRFTPDPNLEILLKAEIDRVRQRGSTAQPIAQGVLPTAQFNDVTLDDKRSVNYDVAPFFMHDQNGVNAQTYQGDVNWTVGPGTLSSTTAYRTARAGATETGAFQRPYLTFSDGQIYHQFSQEIRYAGKAGALDFLAGGYFEHNSIHLYSIADFNFAALSIPLPLLARVTTYDQHVNDYSAFADLTYHLSDSLKISAGARYTITRKSTDEAMFGANFIPGISFDTTRATIDAAYNPAFTAIIRNALNGTVHSFTDIPTREEHFQPQVVAQYQFAPKNMAFLKFVQGAKAGGVDANYTGSAAGAIPAQAQFGPEKARSFEGGLKGIILDNKLEYSLTAYDTTFTNLQTSAFVGTVLFVTNVGKARTRGVELELHARPVSRLSIDTSLNYQDAKYLSYRSAPCTISQTPLPPAPAACTQDLSGAPTPFNSKVSGSFGVSYDIPVGGYSMQGGWNLVYRSKYNTSTNNDPLGEQKALMTLDAHLDLKPSNGWWTLSLFGRNLTNELYKEYSVAAPLIRGGFNTYLSRGRQVGMRLGVNF